MVIRKVFSMLKNHLDIVRPLKSVTTGYQMKLNKVLSINTKKQKKNSTVLFLNSQ